MEYAIRSLTDTETRYAQTEKEMLAIVLVLEHFNQHTFVRHVYIEGDHKPLEIILQKPLARAPRRLQLVSAEKTCTWPTCCQRRTFPTKAKK